MKAKGHFIRPVAVLALAFCAAKLAAAQTSPAVAPAAAAASAPAAAAADPLLTAQFDWAEVTPKMFSAGSPAQSRRALLLGDLAVFNALNAITPRYKAFTTPGPALEAAPLAAPQAAIAAAIRTVLSSVPGIDSVTLEKTYVDQLSKVKDAAARAKGVTLGQRAALALMAMRVDDELGRVEPPMRTPGAGVFMLEADRKQQSSVAFGRLKPYGVVRIEAFDPGPPPLPLGDAARRDGAEVKAIGARDSKQRTADQTAAAIFWNSGEDTDFVVVLKELATARKMSAIDIARLLALSSLCDMDAGIAGARFKEKYNYWRPYSEIRGTFADPTLRDDAWEPLLRTPPNPDYPSGGGIAGGTLSRLLEVFNPDGAYKLSWFNSAINVRRSWPTPEAMGRELANARVWGGIHHRSAVEAGYALGRRVVDEMLGTQLTALP